MRQIWARATAPRPGLEGTNVFTWAMATAFRRKRKGTNSFTWAKTYLAEFPSWAGRDKSYPNPSQILARIFPRGTFRKIHGSICSRGGLALREERSVTQTPPTRSSLKIIQNPISDFPTWAFRILNKFQKIVPSWHFGFL